jgi:hypothetical protein
MSKVITFSRFFPATHPKKGQPTYFVEKIFKSLYLMKRVPKELVEAFNFEIMNDDAVAAKHHTIRAGNRWKVGDNFSPRVWSGKPYRSKQIIIASDVEIKKVFNFETYGMTTLINDRPINHLEFSELATNDGLDSVDMYDWLKKPFIGQIICWNENINY